MISIVTTLYNYAHYIEDLLKSVVAQTHTDWEHIIVDDASTDNPYKTIQNYQMAGYNVRYVRLPVNHGYSFAKNYGIRHTTGKYIVMIDADDMLTKRSLEIRKKLLDENPDKLWCHGEVLVTHGDSSDRSQESRNWKRGFRKKLKAAGKDLTKEYHHRLIHAQSVMVRPLLHMRYGLYDPKLRFSSDNEMWRRLIRFGEIPAHTEEFVAVYRVHGARMSRSAYKRKRVAKVKEQIKQDVERRFNEGIDRNNTEVWRPFKIWADGCEEKGKGKKA